MPRKSIEREDGLNKKKNAADRDDDQKVLGGESPSISQENVSEVKDSLNLMTLHVQGDADHSSAAKLSQEAFLKMEETPEEMERYIFDEG